MQDKLYIASKVYIYKIKTNKEIKIKDLYEINKKLTEHKIGRFLYKPETSNYKDAIYITSVFKSKYKVPFIIDTSLEETKYGYSFICVTNGYLFISGKYLKNSKEVIMHYCDKLEYNILSNFLLEDNSMFENIDTKSTKLNRHGIFERSLKGLDLSKSFNPISRSAQLLKKFKVDNNGKKNTISLSTSHINELSNKYTINEYIDWIQLLVQKINNCTETNNYLSNFSQPIPDPELLLGELIPQSILIDISFLQELNVDNIFYKYNLKKGGYKKLFLDKNMIFNLVESYPIFNLKMVNSKLYIVENNTINDLKLKINKKSLKLVSRKLKNIYFEIDDNQTSLLDYINREGTFNVSFDNIEYIYMMNYLIRDDKLCNNKILDFLIDYPELSTCDTEKGKIGEDIAQFDEKSIFHFINNNFKDEYDLIVCDDLGTEIADMIGFISNSKISFFHAKSDTLKNLSASKFHIVVSQALKNLGNMTNLDIEERLVKWNKNYSNTNISRIQNSKNIEDANQLILDTYYSEVSIREVWIVVNFISKESLKLKLEEGNLDIVSIQLIWLLNSFISIVQEAGFRPFIACAR